MTNKTRFTLGIALGFLGVLTINSSTDAATAHTNRGPRDGRVIVRRFDQIVVTILAENQQIFQFPGVSVEKITSDKNDLLSQDTVLRKEASDTAEAVIEAPLSRGLQVLIQESPENSDWIRVRGWGSNEGWIPKSVLTNEVAIVPDEPAPAPVQPAPEVQEATTPPSIESPAPIDSATTPPSVESVPSEPVESATPEAAETVGSATDAPAPESQSADEQIQSVIPPQEPSEPSGNVDSATTPPSVDGGNQTQEAAPQPAENVESATPEQQAAPDTAPESATDEVESATGN